MTSELLACREALKSAREERDKANAILVSWMLRTPAAPETLNEYRAHGEEVFASWRRAAERAEGVIAWMRERVVCAAGADNERCTLNDTPDTWCFACYLRQRAPQADE